MICNLKVVGSIPSSGSKRDVVQLAECLVWDQMVGGSSPLIPTKYIERLLATQIITMDKIE